MRLIDTGYNNAFMNMAIDEALISSPSPVLRFYGWKPAGLSLGYFQDISQINTQFAKDNGIDVVRRLTGGNAVLHEHELTYSFIIDESLMPKSVLESYKAISRGLLLGLRKLGIKAAMNEEVVPGKKSAVCFNDPSWYEIVVDGKKIVGSAQKRVGGKLLQHGAILIEKDVRKYCSCFHRSEELIARLEKRMTSINEVLGRKVSYEKVKMAMADGFKEAINAEFILDGLSREETCLAIKLAKERYSSRQWNKT